MDDTLRMGVRERVGNVNPVPQRRFERKAVAPNQRAELAPLDILHDDVGPAVDVADFVNRADMRVIELRRALRFAPQRELCRCAAAAAPP